MNGSRNGKIRKFNKLFLLAWLIYDYGTGKEISIISLISTVILKLWLEQRRHEGNRDSRG